MIRIASPPRTVGRPPRSTCSLKRSTLKVERLGSDSSPEALTSWVPMGTWTLRPVRTCSSTSGSFARTLSPSACTRSRRITGTRPPRRRPSCRDLDAPRVAVGGASRWLLLRARLAGGGVLQLNHLAVSRPAGRSAPLPRAVVGSLGVRPERQRAGCFSDGLQVRRVGLEGAELLRRRIHLPRHPLEHRGAGWKAALRWRPIVDPRA